MKLNKTSKGVIRVIYLVIEVSYHILVTALELNDVLVSYHILVPELELSAALVLETHWEYPGNNLRPVYHRCR